MAVFAQAGGSLLSGIRNCGACGFEVAPSDRFCANCGNRLLAEEPRPQLAIDDVVGTYLTKRPLREVYFELGAALLKSGQLEKAVEALEDAGKAPGESPPEADVRLALGLAEQKQSSNIAVRHLLEAALGDRSARRGRILAHVQSVLNAPAALANADWAAGEWRKKYESLALAPAERVAGILVVARMQLFCARYEATIAAVDEALAVEPAFTRAEVASWLAPGRLPPAFSKPGGDSLAALARLWRAAGNPTEAVAAADRALLAVAEGKGHPDATIYRLKGELLREVGDAKAAADSYHKAGSRFVWRREYHEAIPLLETAIALDAELVGAYWSLADVLTVASHDKRLGDPAEFVARARKQWEAGYARRPPNESDTWAYAARAFIAAREPDVLPGRSRSEALWEAVAFVERALVIAPGSAENLAHLSRFHRSLHNLRTALDTALAAHAANSESTTVLEEAIIILSNVGRYDEARQRLAKLAEKAPSAWMHFVASRLHLYSGRAADALSELQKALELEPESVVYLETAAIIHRCLGDAAEADRISAEILEDADDSDRDNLAYYAWAALERGQLERAERLYAEEAARSADDPMERAGSDRYRAVCRLAAGKTEEARKLFRDAAKQPATAETKALLGINLRNAREQLAHAWAKPQEAVKVLAEFEKMVHDLPLAPRAESPRAELDAAAIPAGAVWPAIGVEAGRARMDSTEGRHAEAAEAYRRLMRWSREFPEAASALLAAAEGLQQAGDDLLYDGEPKPAMASYLKALGHVEALTQRREPGRPPEEASVFKACGDLESRLAYARFHAKDLKSAAASCKSALSWYAKRGDPEPPAVLGRVLAELVRSTSHYWALDEWLATLGKELAPARYALEGAMERIYRLSETMSRFPMTTPIAVELEPSLAPQGEEKDQPVLATHLPEMRKRIGDELGVAVPGVRLRQNEIDLPRRGYSILIDEVPVASGNLPADKLYCPAAAQVVGGPDLEDAEDPVTGRPGCWVPRSRWEEVRKAGCPLWDDPLRYMVRHLEAVLRRDLRRFLGMQETDNLIEDWQGKEHARGRVRAAMATPEARARLRRLLRELVREQVSIAQWRPIIETLRAAADVDEATVRKVRLRLKSSLPGNRPGDRTVDLPAALEQQIVPWLTRRDGRAFLAIPPEDTQKLLQQIRDLTQQEGERCILVTRKPELRPFLRRLVEIEFPLMLVLASDERMEAQGRR